MVRVGLGRVTPVNARTVTPAQFLLDFVDAGSGVVVTAPAAGGVSATYTRSTPASTVLSTGLIGTVSSGQPRSYYDPTSLTYLGYLAEGARTNLLLRSEDTTNASWSKTDTTPTLSGTGPDGGTNTANLLTEGTAGTAFCRQAYTATANATQCFSVFLKRGNTDWVQMVVFETAAAANQISGYFNLNTGVVGSAGNGGTGTGAAISIQAFPNGWYRCSLRGAVNNGATALSLQTNSATADGNSTRVSNSTRLHWGAQVEDNVSFASSYIATAGSTVTRNADVLTYPTTGWLSQTAGTVMAQFMTYALDAANNKVIVAIDDGTANERMSSPLVDTSNRGSLFVVDGGVTQANISGTNTVSANVSAKCASAYALNSFAVSLNGEAPATSGTGTLPTTTTLRVAHRENSTQFLFGAVRRIAYFATRLSNSQLQQITS